MVDNESHIYFINLMCWVEAKPDSFNVLVFSLGIRKLIF